MTESEKLTENIRVRISKSMKNHLSFLASQRGPGTKLSDLAREAIHQVYFNNFAIAEITKLPAPEKPHKAKDQ
jgi:hypothetical protein